MLMSIPFASIIYQKMQFPIHGAALVPNNETGATILVGASGSGKSTTSAALTMRGWKLMADDISRVESRTNKIHKKNELNTYSGYVNIKLTPHSCDLLGLNYLTLEKTSTHIDKYYYPPERKLIGNSKINEIIILNRNTNISNFEWARCRGEVAKRAITPHFFKKEIGVACGANFNKILNDFSTKTPVFLLSIPKECTPFEIANEIEDELINRHS